MNTDRELLSLAAKAVGIHEVQDILGNWRFERPPLPDGSIRSTSNGWNPLENDCDAFQMLAAMPSLWSLSLKFGSPSVVMDVAWGFKGIKVVKFNGQNTDRAAVIRRAIVEAAAECGRDSDTNPVDRARGKQ
jgi:hypothetical protein